MSYRSIISATVLLLFFCSCRKHIREADQTSIKHIKIRSIEGITTLPFEQLFDSCKVVPLETTRLSLIGTINRIWHYSNRYYILDRSTNSIFIFDKNGKYLTKIHDIGSEPGQYIGLMDFSIADNKIIVHSHRPYKLLYYDLNGKFESEIRLNDYFMNIGSTNHKIVLINQSGPNLIYSMDIKNHTIERFLPSSKRSEIFENFSTVYPNFIQSKAGYITFPYSNIVYKFSADTLKAVYDLDFGTNNVPEDHFNDTAKAKNIYKDAMHKNYGFFISNFKETDDFLYFTYGKAVIVVYSKKYGTSTSFNFVNNSQGFINFENCFAHDGFDDQIMSIYKAPNFKTQMEVYRSSPKIWQKVPSYLKSIDGQTSPTSNPLLVIYQFKKQN